MKIYPSSSESEGGGGGGGGSSLKLISVSEMVKSSGISGSSDGIGTEGRAGGGAFANCSVRGTFSIMMSIGFVSSDFEIAVCFLGKS